MENLKARIQWQVSADVVCPDPECEETNNFMDQDEWWVTCGLAEAKEFDRPEKIKCKGCGKIIEINGSDY